MAGWQLWLNSEVLWHECQQRCFWADALTYLSKTMVHRVKGVPYLLLGAIYQSCADSGSPYGRDPHLILNYLIM